ncbi:MAG: radical SAM protein [Chloroflexia bacterium]|nr:radical SAM protein [Chloroflexia bacterium]
MHQQSSHILPLKVSLALTERCNLHCAHCYINQPVSDTQIRTQELSLKQWQGILDQMAAAGVLWIMVTGGEPLLRPDFADFYRYAKRLGFHVILLTNGTLLTPEMADLFVEYPPWEIEITIYGATAATYERVTAVPGSYARFRRGIALLRERGLALTLKAMILTLNVHELPAMRQLAEGSIHTFRYDFEIHSRLDGDRSPLAYRLSPEEIVALEREDPERMQQWRQFCSRPWQHPNPDLLFNCGAGLHSLDLDPYGGLYPCLLTRWLRYDLLNGSLQSALQEFLPAVRKTPLTHNRTCRQCGLYLLCKNCPAWAYCETGNPEAPEPFQCRLAYLRQRELGLKIQFAPDPTSSSMIPIKEV